MLIRSSIALVLAISVTFSLLFVMQKLIEIGKTPLKKDDKLQYVDFVRVKQDESTQTKKVKPKKPPPPEEPPPEMPEPQTESLNPDVQTISISAPNMGNELDMGGIGMSSADGDYLPLVKVNPIYPRRAQSRGLEGSVLLEFTVTKSGAVINAIVIEADPPRIFDNAAIKAALKFKYKPRVVDGEPIDVVGVQHLITFKMEGK